MNYDVLRTHAREIFDAGLKAVDPIYALNQHVTCSGDELRIADEVYDLKTCDRILIIGGGKAGAAMAQGIEGILGDRITAGVLSIKYDHALPTQTIELLEAAHPIPDQAGVQNSQRIVELLQSAGGRDLVLCLISGGGSALLPAPATGLTLEQKQVVTKRLLDCGAPIQEINTIRKHLSAIKGGQLARLAAPARLVSLILSDVIGDPLDMIASGPTVPDTTTFADCIEILEKYSLKSQLPGAVCQHLCHGQAGHIPDTPKPGDDAFFYTQNVIIASNRLAAEAAATKARELGYTTTIDSTEVEGETRDVAQEHVVRLCELVKQGGGGAICLITGGETTVTLQGDGKGGRNQEFALAAALAIPNEASLVVFSAGTDGTDGPTDAAGAIVDPLTRTRALDQGLAAQAYLDNNDAYAFFDALGDLVKTGPTHTNVMDLHILLANA